MMDGLVVAGVAHLAGGQPGDALRLGLAMTSLQFGIGAANDIVDAPRDVGHKPGKPIPAGLVGSRAAGAIAIGAFGTGLLLSTLSGVPAFALALAVIGIGLAYDLRLKGTPWSWLPFAVGIPLLPVFGWAGVTGGLPPAFALLVPVAVAGGAALAISNGLTDVERDRAAGVSSIATALGPPRAWAMQAALVGSIVAVAVASVALLGAPTERIAVVAAAGALPLAGLVLGRSGGPDRRERAWQLEAIGLAATGVTWIWATLG